MKIIAFGHKKRVGKDQAAKLLYDRLRRSGFKFRRAAFADKLYSVAHDLYSWAGMGDKQYYDDIAPHEKEIILPAIGKSPRQILIDLGTNAVRKNVYDKTWVDYLLRGTEDNLIISDMRFPNEFEAVKKAGGICIRIDRPSIPNSDDVADCALDNETGWDRVIVNSSSLRFLEDAVFDAVREYIC